MSESLSRRQLLKVLAAAAGGAILSSIPNKWKTPVVDVGMLPARAQSLSGSGTVAGFAIRPNDSSPIRHSPQTVCSIPDFSTGIQGVVVTVDGFPLLTATTDQNGFYSISNVPAGSRNLTATFGPTSIPGTTTVPVGSTVCLNFGFTPICLSEDTRIDTPTGEVCVTDITVGMSVWTRNATGLRTPAPVVQIARRPVPTGMPIIHLSLSDGRAVSVSAPHPTADGRTIGELVVGDMLDGARVDTVDAVPYNAPARYDLLPAGETGSYWANGILMNSTIDVTEKQRIPAHA